MFIKNNAFVNGYGEPCEIIYIDINNIWHVLDPLISRLNALHTLSVLTRSGEGRDTHSGREAKTKMEEDVFASSSLEMRE